MFHKSFSKDEVALAVRELDKVRGEWLKRPGVTAVDVGYKIRGRKLTDELALRVHVEKKRPATEVVPEELFNDPQDPTRLGELPVDVIEARYRPANHPGVATVDVRTTHQPALVGGLSVGGRFKTGTLGAVVYHHGKPCVLSNWHVLAGAKAKEGDPVVQPGHDDGGTHPEDFVATLRYRQLDGVDAALAEVKGGTPCRAEVLEIGEIRGIVEPVLGMEVRKSGRTSGVTEGVIDGVSHSVRMSYDGLGEVVFHDQVHIVPRAGELGSGYEVSEGGDSGSVWVDAATTKAVGLHFAGEGDDDPSEHAVAAPMGRVAELLGFSFQPGDTVSGWVESVPQPVDEPIPEALANAIRGFSPEEREMLDELVVALALRLHQSKNARVRHMASVQQPVDEPIPEAIAGTIVGLDDETAQEIAGQVLSRALKVQQERIGKRWTPAGEPPRQPAAR